MGFTSEFLKRPLKGKKLGFSFAAALFVAVFLCLEAHSYLKIRQAKLTDPRYLVASRDLGLGNQIYFSDLTLVVGRSISGKIPAGALTDQDLSLLSGSRLSRDLRSGEVLTASHLEARVNRRLAFGVPSGSRAFALTEIVAPEVKAGDRVDVYFTSQVPEMVAALLLENVPVLRYVFEDSRLVVAVSPSDIGLLEKARRNGSLSVALRNPEEKAPAGKTFRQLWPNHKKKSSGVEVWEESE